MSAEQYETAGSRTSRASLTVGSGESDLLYVGFWKRLAAYLLDFAIFLPYGIGVRHLIYSNKYALLGNLAVTSIFGLVFWVYLVKRFGGSPGKLLLRIKIVKIDGRAIGYQEAIIRYLVPFAISTASSGALVLAFFRMPEDDYSAYSDSANKAAFLLTYAPSWYPSLQMLILVWAGAELMALLCNDKRRTLHDFMAGTVVIETPKTP
jgi:uncharacterized RDD family membrane protein YckC